VNGPRAVEGWDAYFHRLCDVVATRSKDPHTQVGAVIVGEGRAVLATGYNGFPRGVDDARPERWERPAKYDWLEHAERNAIFNAARTGARLEGATLYVPCHPCHACARAIVQAGIASVQLRQPRYAYAWQDPGGRSARLAVAILEEGGVTLVAPSAPSTPTP
jgi:dCMP deaminase